MTTRTRKEGEKPVISDSARARIDRFNEELQKLQNLWGVSLEFSGAADSLVLIDNEREDDYDGKADYDAVIKPDGNVEIETFDWWGK